MTKKKYQKPTVNKSRNTTVVLKLIRGASARYSCRQCSGCHGCR